MKTYFLDRIDEIDSILRPKFQNNSVSEKIRTEKRKLKQQNRRRAFQILLKQFQKL